MGVGTIGKWDPATQTTTNLLTATGTYANNYTKGSPSLQADLFGDWREEVLWRTDGQHRPANLRDHHPQPSTGS